MMCSCMLFAGQLGIPVKSQLNTRPSVLTTIRLIQSFFTTRHKHFTRYYSGEWFLNPVCTQTNDDAAYAVPF